MCRGQGRSLAIVVHLSALWFCYIVEQSCESEGEVARGRVCDDLNSVRPHVEVVIEALFIPTPSQNSGAMCFMSPRSDEVDEALVAVC